MIAILSILALFGVCTGLYISLTDEDNPALGAKILWGTLALGVFGLFCTSGSF